MKKADFVDKEKIYMIRLPGDKELSDLAVNPDPEFEDFKGICYESSPERGHMIRGKLGRKTKTGFTFIADEDTVFPGEWEFVEVTYEGMKEGRYGKIIGSDEILEQVSNTKELQDWYHKHF